MIMGRGKRQGWKDNGGDSQNGKVEGLT